jgi:hypothetical protein
MLMSALSTLAAAPNCQVIVTTHTPMLARTMPEESLRLVDCQEDGSRRILTGGGDVNELIAKSLGILPDNSVRLFLGVEGKHDIAFLKAMSKVLTATGEAVPNLEKLELDGELIFFPFGGENLVLWASRLRYLNRPEFHICDRDTEPPAPAKYQNHMDQVNAREQCTAVATAKREMENYLHPDAVVEAYAEDGIQIALNGLFAIFEDVPETVARSVHIAAPDGADWDALDEAQRKKKAAKAKVMLNQRAAARMTAARLNQVDSDGEILGWFREMDRMMQDAV